MNMRSQENTSGKKERNTDIVWVAQNVPNIRLSICYFKIVTIWALPTYFTNSVSHMTLLTSPRNSRIYSSHQESLSKLSPQPPIMKLRHAHDHIIVVSLFLQTSWISILPHTCLQQIYAFQTSPKSSQKKLAQLFPSNPPQGSTSLPMLSDLVPWGSSPFFIYLRTIELFFLSFSSNIPSWLCTLFPL
jgi:hypothetical protein